MSIGNFKNSVLIFFTILFFFVLGSGYIYNKNLKYVFKFETEENLKVITNTNSSYIKDLIKSDLTTLETSAFFVSDYQLLEETKNLNNNHIMEILTKRLSNVKFSTLLICDAKGYAKTTDGKSVNISDREYFNRAMKGNTVIEAGLTSKINGSEVAVFESGVTSILGTCNLCLTFG
ncbi:MAG: hypothetical protein K0R18_2630 [Bacillales bacterium]|jgi:hypothetical protein|nr:hypothetical protein [Bacillales bacterium]